MSLFFNLLKRYKLLIVFITLINLVIGIFYFFIKYPKTYEGIAEVIILPPEPDILLPLQTYYFINPKFNYQTIIESWTPKNQIKKLVNYNNISFQNSNYPYLFYFKYKSNNEEEILQTLNKLVNSIKTKSIENNKVIIFNIYDTLETQFINIGNKIIDYQNKKFNKTGSKRSIEASFLINLRQRVCDNLILKAYLDLLINNQLITELPLSFEKENILLKEISNYYSLIWQEKSKKSIYLAKLKFLELQNNLSKEWKIKNLKNLNIKNSSLSVDKFYIQLLNNYIDLSIQYKINSIYEQVLKNYTNKINISIQNFEVINYSYDILNKRMPIIRSLRQDKLETVFVNKKPYIIPINRFPNLIPILAIFFSFSVILNIIIISLIEIFDKSISKDRLKKIFYNIPELGIVPWINKKQERLIIYYPLIMESYRTIRNNIKSLLNNKENTILSILSILNGEGRTSTIVGLAINLALSGKRVLLIDTNTYNPMLHIIFGLSNEIGISTIVERKIILKEAIQLTSQQNLEVITIGKSTNNLDNLVSSDTFTTLLQSLRYNYNYILLDSPSLIASSDGYNLAKVSDYVLLLVGISKITSKEIKILTYYINTLKDKILGYIIKEK